MSTKRIDQLTAATAGEITDLIEILRPGTPASFNLDMLKVKKIIGTPRGALVGITANIVDPSVPYIVPWTTEAYDTDAIHDNSTNNTRLYVPAGWSWVRLQVQLNVNRGTSGSAASVNIRKNSSGTDIAHMAGGPFSSLPAENTGAISMNVSTPPLQVVGDVDYFDVRLGSVDTTITLLANGSWFSMELLA
jgi:hypothetical protein